MKHVKHRNLATALFLAVLAFLSAGVAHAVEDIVKAAATHDAEMLKHMKEALKSGRAGNTEVLVTHARQAKKHASLRLGLGSSYSVENAALHLRKAIKAGKSGDAAGATAHVEEAFAVLESEAPVDSRHF